MTAPLYCDAGWKHYGTSCYKFNMVRRKWVDARTDCHQSGGYLVKVDDADEQHYLTYTLKSMTKVSRIIDTDEYFIHSFILPFIHPSIPSKLPTLCAFTQFSHHSSIHSLFIHIIQQTLAEHRHI